MGVGTGSDAKDRDQSVSSLHGTFYRLISSDYQNEEKGVIGMKKTVAIVFVFVLMLSSVGCNKQQLNGHDTSPNSSETADGNYAPGENEESMRYEVCVDWMDFIKLDGITYIGDWGVTEVSADRIGEKIGEVICGAPKVYTDGAGNVSSSEPENGAAFLCEMGTEIFSVVDSEKTVAAFVDGKYYLYVSEKHPTGFDGEKLYINIDGIPLVYERYQPGTGDLTSKTVLDSFETETEIEGVVWEVYSTEEYPDLSYVLVISGTNASWTYRVSDE